MRHAIFYYLEQDYIFINLKFEIGLTAGLDTTLYSWNLVDRMFPTKIKVPGRADACGQMIFPFSNVAD